MNRPRVPTTILGVALLGLALLFLSGPPAQAQDTPPDPVQEATVNGVLELLTYLDQIWLLPNDLDFDFMQAQRPTDLAILLGLSLRSQTPHLERDPSLTEAFRALGRECSAYLAWLAENTQAVADPWGNLVNAESLNQFFHTAVATTDFDQYSIDHYGVDPLPLVHTDLLTPIAAVLGRGSETVPDESFIYEARDNDSIVLLGQEAPPVESPAITYNASPAEPQPEPEPVNIDPVQERDILGNWRHKKSGMLLVIKRGGKAGSYEGRFPNAAYEDWGEGLEFYTNNFQLKDTVLRMSFKQENDWGLVFEGRYVGANGWDFPLHLTIVRDDKNRLVLNYSSTSLNGGPYFRD